MRLTLTCSVACWILASGFACATHLRGGEITLKKNQCGTGEYEVIVTLYTDSNMETKAGAGVLSFGDGATLTLPALQNIVIDVQYHIGKAVFTTTHTFDKPGDYLVSYIEPNRNPGIVNMKNSVDTRFYIETALIVTPPIACNHPPLFNILPIDKACPGKTFFHNPGVSDPDGDSLSYEIVTPKQSPAADVNDYFLPNNASFYAGMDFQHANESGTTQPTFTLNAVTGDLVWDAPGKVGQYEVAIKVIEWKKASDVWIKLGYTIRDMQIIVEDCHNSRPTLNIQENKCVSPGDNLSYTINGSDPDGDPVLIEVFTADNYGSSLPVVTRSGTVQPAATANVGFNWTIACDHVRDQSYNIVFKITDQPSAGVRLITFYTWTISVVGRAPEFSTTTLDLNSKALQLSWKPYSCSGNAPSMEVWRRVGDPGTQTDRCIRGLPRSQGFEKIAEVKNVNSFVDRDIDPGAKYCYRLVALFETPYKSKSASSLAVCIGPIVAYAPVLTNVSVLKTDVASGEIMVKWTRPFQINKVQFPPPYEYDILRTNDGKSFSKIASRIIDTTFVDRGVNTQAVSYGYKVVMYSPSGLTHENPVDTSALGFYPRLEPKAQAGSIYLQWNAEVPWSNQSDRFSWHYIYRKVGGEEFVLIDSVNVNDVILDAGFDYTDRGKFKGQKLQDNTVHRYRVHTRGVYGNPLIHEPLINFSNETDAQMSDLSPPCKPSLSINKIDCASFLKSASCDFPNSKIRCRGHMIRDVATMSTTILFSSGMMSLRNSILLRR